MTINPTEISDIIKDKIKNLDIKTQSHNEGTVVSLTDGIARIYGITDALQGEMLEFPNNIYGLALNDIPSKRKKVNITVECIIIIT